MLRFNNDYNHGAHEEILKALMDTNNESYGGYGLDSWCDKASDEIKKNLADYDFDIHFMLGGTQVNYTVCDLALRPYQSVIAADSSHINVHETGAVEHTGHKIETRPAVDGRLSADAIREIAEGFRTSETQEHITEPKMVFISFPSETGTIYTKEELTEIRKVCDEYGLYMYVDGARMGYGLGSEKCDITLKELSALADIFYIGGTKCGALFGEAVVIRNDDLKKGFRSYMKQNGGMLAKGWLLGLQFYTLFKDGLYFSITREADAKAMRIKKAFSDVGIELAVDSYTNQQFVLLDNETHKKLSEHVIFETEGKQNGKYLVRFCTSWSSTDIEIDELIDLIKAL